MNDRSIDEQVDLLMHGAEYGDEQTKEHMAKELRERLAEGRPLRVYCGYDPTSPDLHLGHTVTMRKLRQFQDLGHQAIFVIGTFTALIGDPSDKDKARPRPSLEEVEENAHTYAEQAFKILDPERTEVRYNGEWLSQLDFEDIVELTSHFTVQQFLVRDNFAKRHQRGDAIWLHEFLYALMQGYDAVALEADVQIGATEQLFNLLAGRKLQESHGQKPQICITFPILVGTDGKQRMSKSLGNYIGIDEPPEEMYGKVMSLPDEAMPNYFDLVTRWDLEKIDRLKAGLADGSLHPRDVKMKLAREIVDVFHGQEAAKKAQEHFRTVFQKRRLPDDMPERTLSEPINLVDLIYEAEMARSKSQARRLVQQGAVRLDDEKIREIDATIEPQSAVLRVGKRRFLRLHPAESE
jgi:tyrosyl-tRNA synthetase